MRTLLLHAIAVLKVIAQMTTSKIDDELVKLLEAIADEPTVLDWLTAQAAADPENMMAASDEPPAELAAALAAARIEWKKIIEYLPAILAILKALI